MVIGPVDVQGLVIVASAARFVRLRLFRVEVMGRPDAAGPGRAIPERRGTENGITSSRIGSGRWTFEKGA